jgi:hypothetical protein
MQVAALVPSSTSVSFGFTDGLVNALPGTHEGDEMARFPLPEQTPELLRFVFVSQTEKMEQQSNRADCRTRLPTLQLPGTFTTPQLACPNKTATSAVADRNASRQNTCYARRKSRCESDCQLLPVRQSAWNSATATGRFCSAFVFRVCTGICRHVPVLVTAAQK